MRVLVTGGAGYIGSHTARLLDRLGHEVWVYDNLVRGHRAAVLPGRLIEGSLADQDRLTDLLRAKAIDAVLHFAAYALVGESVEQPQLYYQNNVVGTLHLLEAMRLAGVQRIVFSSTTATYGVPQTVPITEQERQEPINPYGFTKLVIERALADHAAAFGWGYATLRYFNAAGAAADGTLGEDHDPETHLIPNVLKVALGQRAAITIFGQDYPTPDGTCIRDYIHVEDLAEAHVRALDQIADGARLQLNLGTGQGHSVLQVIEACREVTGQAIPVVSGPRRPGDPPELVADCRKAARVLNWQPRYTDLRAIVQTAWQWHRRHPQGFADRPATAQTEAPSR